MAKADHYGDFYYCVKVTKDLSPDGEIYIYADDVNTGRDGSLFLWHRDLEKQSVFPNMIIPNGKWLAIFSASCLDGHAVAVEHWKGEVIPG
jgi:hypothetical protein